jgi:hypothetical protein
MLLKFFYKCLILFVDSPHCSELEVGGGAVTVSFSKYLPWQAMYFFQRSTVFPRLPSFKKNPF